MKKYKLKNDNKVFDSIYELISYYEDDLYDEFDRGANTVVECLQATEEIAIKIVDHSYDYEYRELVKTKVSLNNDISRD